MKTESFGELSGQDWEDICNKLFHLRYKDNYQEVPARYGGDYGIEGFTFDGDLFQCYCPEDEEFSSKSLYQLQMEKITKDIKKLISNILKLRELNKNAQIKNWHFVTPKYDSKNLVEHCRKKEQEVQKAIAQNVTKDFKIILQTENAYIEEISHLVNANILKISSNVNSYSDEDLELIAVSKNDIINKIKNKLLKDSKFKQDEEKLNNATLLIFKFFIEGEEELARLQKSFPDIYKKLNFLKNNIEKEIELQSTIGLEYKDLKSILQQHKETLEKDFKDSLEHSVITNLAQEAIADWMARCPIDFE